MIGLGFLLFRLAAASPFHGCTFLKPRLVQQSWPGGLGQGCASFVVASGACTTPLGTGDLVMGWLPSHFVEVTPHFGFSVFAADPDGSALKEQLELAVRYWQEVLGTDLSPDLRALVHTETGYVDPTSGAMEGFLHARVIEVPYKGTAWSFSSLGKQPDSLPPTCFAGLSELAPETWADQDGHPETELAQVHARAAASLCALPRPAGLSLSAPSVPGKGTPCAMPVPAALARARVLGEGSLGQQVCAGRLGPHLPRTGHVTTPNDWHAANLAAYRLTTLAKDHAGAGPGIGAGDRWQLVWPPAMGPGAHRCFLPGDRTEGPLERPSVPLTDGPSRPTGTGWLRAEGGSPYVFAVWKPFQMCTGSGAFHQEISTTYASRKAACAALNTTDRMP